MRGQNRFNFGLYLNKFEAETTNKWNERPKFSEIAKVCLIACLATFQGNIL
jgi:hypothetical protein